MNTKQILPVVVIVVMACFKNYAQTAKVSAIGSPISTETAQAWTAKFQSANPDQVSGHTYGKVILAKLLASPGASGIYFFNGLDEKGKVHLILRAANEERIPQGFAVNVGVPCPPHCPPDDIVSSIGRVIDEGLAQQWISTFGQTFPGRTQAHLYGKEIINSLLSRKGVEGIFFAYGIDEKNIEHLVLAGVTGEGQILWEDPINMGEMCPPNCHFRPRPTASNE
jgi:hypothetical protein